MLNLKKASFRPVVLVLLLLFANFILNMAAPASIKAADANPQFVKVSGFNLTLNGQPLRLKGHNFYPYQNPWAEMWKQWDGPEVQTEVGQAALLGDNVLRILVPYGAGDAWNDDQTGQVNSIYLDELHQMVQIAGNAGMKVILTLFDFYGDFPAVGSVAANANRTYAQTIVRSFADDDRVLAWDIHNEPDNYPAWSKDKHYDAVLDWTARMREAISEADPNHLITVGVGFYENIWRTDSQGRSFASLSDYISLHSYNALDFGNEVYHIREHEAHKPILMEETGWPTGPATHDPHFTEAEQLKVWQLAMQTVVQQNLVGVLGWVLRDQVPNGLISPDDNQYYYGVIRRNGTLKPAALAFRSGFAVEPLPSVTTSALPLTAQPRNGLANAEYFPQTDHYVPTPLKELWRRAGGEAIFGLPLTEAFVDRLSSDGTPYGPGARIVQYFERARFEYYPDRLHEPDFRKYSNINKYFYIVDFGKLGQELNPSGPAVARARPDGADYRYFAATGHDLSGPFLTFWTAHYGDHVFGNPITQPQNLAGRIVQTFERARLEYDPAQPAGVEVARLGEAALQATGVSTAGPADLAAGVWADPAFEGTWRRVDGPVQSGLTNRSWLWGPSGFAAVLEPYAQGEGGSRLVQYFDKSRMEITRPTAPTDNKYYVTNGLLVKEMIAGQVQTGDATFVAVKPAPIAIAGDPTQINPTAPTYASLTGVASLQPGQNRATSAIGQPVRATLSASGQVGQGGPAATSLDPTVIATYIEATGHNIPAVFWHYLNDSRGPLLTGPGDQPTTGDVVDWLYSTGLPLTEAYWTRARVGGVEQWVLVQAFERRLLTYTPSNPTAYGVEMGNVGRHYYQWRYAPPPR